MNNFEGIVALFVPIVSSIGLFTMIVMLRSYSNKERMAMIERGMNPADLKVWMRRRNDPYRSIRLACAAVGVGIGLFVGNVLRSTDIEMFNRNGIVVGLTFIGGGLGLLIGFFIQYGLKKDNRDKGLLDNTDDDAGII
jgi:CBS domain containing-hemolysin-like protein